MIEAAKNNQLNQNRRRHLYPDSITALYQDANQSAVSYWKELVNPFDQRQGHGKAYQDLKQQAQPGAVAYQAIPDPKTAKVTTYRIYGYDPQGKRVQDKDKDFTLNNID